MSMNNLVQDIEKRVEALLAEDPAYFLVEVRIKPTNNVKVYVDGDQGISIEKCVALNRALYKQLEASNLFPDGDFSLELSSPGLDEPLKLYRQYLKNLGRPVEVVLHDGRKIEGTMKEVDDTGLMVEEIKGRRLNGKPVGKKLEKLEHRIPFTDIKSTHIQITF
jgi:ribosome maturation factor RimP